MNGIIVSQSLDTAWKMDIRMNNEYVVKEVSVLKLPGTKTRSLPSKVDFFSQLIDHVFDIRGAALAVATRFLTWARPRCL